ncbi:ady3p [Saccharomyces arboricola H-6]|uniref:Ady3p n=1 Tax=Saccharomyces arboricola (strain H-6 / AS 2.3317 / CBS 10644) TaxID=1160507 RepID=J8Q450_SACAR|nr:ady3p [Saccharomyces arboricola H-6]
MNHWLAFLNKPEILKEQDSSYDGQGGVRNVVNGTPAKSQDVPSRMRRSQTWIESETPAAIKDPYVQENSSSYGVSKLPNRHSRRNRSGSWTSSRASSPARNISTLEDVTGGIVPKSPNKFLQRGGLPTVGIGSQALSPAGKPSTLGNVSPGKFTAYKTHNNIEMNTFASTPTKISTDVHEARPISSDEVSVMNCMHLEEKIEIAHVENVFCSSKATDEEESEYIKLREIRLSSSSYSENISNEEIFPNMLGELQLKTEEIKVLQQKLDEKDSKIQELEEFRSLINTKLEKIESLQKTVRDEKKAANKRLQITQDQFRKEIVKIRAKEMEIFEYKCKSKEEGLGMEKNDTKCKTFPQRNLLISELYGKQKRILSLQKERDTVSEDLKESKESIKKLETEVGILEDKLKTCKVENKELKENSSFYEKRLNDIYSYMQNLPLFEKDLGKFILEEMKHGHAPSTFQNRFTKFYPDIKDIKHFERMEQYKQLKEKIQTMEKNDRVRLEKISSFFKLISERLHFIQQQHNEKIQCVQKEMSTKEQQFRLEKRRWHDILNLKEESFKKLKSELDEKLTLSEKIQKNAEEKLNEYINEHKEVTDKLQSQFLTVEKLNIQIEESNSKHKKITDELVGMQDEIFKYEEKIESLMEDVSQEKLNLKTLYGDPSTELNFETVGKSFPHVTKDKYDSLGLDILTDLTYVQSQNLIKNLLIVLDIPLKTFLKVVPTIVIQLRCELTLLTRFANDLNLKVFGKQIDFKSRRKIAMNEFLSNHDIAEVKHPLNYDLQALFKYFFS